jgi:hypothetical protein
LRPATTIRRADSADAEGIAEVFLEARATMDYLPDLESADETREFIRHILGEREVFVAVREDRPVGFVCLHGEWLEHLYVHPECFNMQTGTQLLERAKAIRPDGFQLWVFQQNEGARRFCERHGCAIARLTDGRGNEENLPDVLYVWPPTREPST